MNDLLNQIDRKMASFLVQQCIYSCYGSPTNSRGETADSSPSHSPSEIKTTL